MTGPTSGGGELPALAPYPVAPARTGRGRVLVASVLGVLAVVATTTFALTAFGDDRAADPEAAVEAMFAAIEDGDVLGVLDVLAPAERAAVRPFVEDLVDELERLEVLDGVDLGSVDGFDLEVQDLALSSRTLADGIVAVTIEGGTLRSTVRPAEVPLGPLLRSFLDEESSGLEEATTTSDLVGGEPVDLVVIDDDGWHVSLGYTVAELARTEAGAPLPDFAAGLVPTGSASPDGAVEALLRAAADIDVAGLLALLPPGEMAAVHDYAPLFLADAEAEVAELRATTDVAVSIDRLDTEVARDGDAAEVRITGFAVSGAIDGEAFAASFDGECVVVEAPGMSDEQCVDEADGAASGLGTTELTLVAVEVDGSWFVSPLRSALGQGIAALRFLQPEDLRNPMALAERVLGGSSLLFGSGTGLAGPSLDAGEPSPSEPGTWSPYSTCTSIYEDLPEDAGAEQWDEADAAVEECLAEAGEG